MVIDKSFKKFVVPSLVILVLFAILVIAATSNYLGTKVVSPITGTNWSGNSNGAVANSTQVLFNVTFLNGTDIWDPVNATFLLNYSAAGWGILGNSSRCVNGTGLGGGSFCSGNLNVSVWANGSAVKDGVYTVNATISNHSGLSATPSVNASNMTTIIVDNTDPETAAFSTLTSGNNFSTHVLGGNLNITINAVDRLANISNVVVYLVNATGSLAGNVTLYAAQAQSTPTWFASLNVSHVPDGTYNLTLLVNDTAGNFNRTANGTTYSAQAILRNMIIDNTLPSASASCSSTTVDVGDDFPCSCSGSDDLSGINSTSASSTAPQGVGVPQSSGTFQYTCTSVDRVGLSKSSTATYTVQEGSSGSSSGSGSGSGTSGTSGGSTGGTTPPVNGSSTGSAGSGSGSGGSGQAQGSAGSSGGSSGGFTMGWIIAIIVIAAIVAGIIIMVKRKN